MRASRTYVRLLAAGAAIVMLAGCTSEPDDQLGPPSPGLPDAGEDFDGLDVPPVEEPLELGTLADNPCEALPDEWLAEHGYTEPPSGISSPEEGLFCRWDSPESRRDSISITIGTLVPEEDDGGLQRLYRRHELGVLRYFEETTISGYPAVFSDVNELGQDFGNARITVGIRDDLTFEINIRGPRAELAVVEAKAADAAKQVIDTLR
ncbi:DUF3558 domain-containing protein [Haloechinothrix sp. LS1_15]|uniref:DUF3558 domain-containing protein n=1 Tax=Haloechinothrix sp. LS1_15 TaxID=2652248 RepID=UPI002944292E|nr:DUF3558 domain-containing protein [Haloechinothrix sp. LS1_15]MDV6012494.1 DUF3558 domain-containing protein [Haloechinothrix sp. LS1_15]